MITLLLYFYFKNSNKAIGLLLIISVANIVLTDVLKHFGIHTFFNNNIYVFVHNLIWLIIIKKFCLNKKLLDWVIVAFLLFNCILFFKINIFKEFSYDAFVLGALLYSVIFVFESYINLKNEKLSFFLSNEFIIVFAPIFFYFGLSLMFAFVSVAVTQTVIFKNIVLYEFVNYYVNFIYYLLINIYIIKNRVLKYDKL